MNRLRQITFCLALFCVTASAQDFSSLAQKAPWLKAFFGKMCPDISEFSTEGTMEICNTNGVAQIILPMNLAVSSNCLRWDFDMMQVWPSSSQAFAAAKLVHLDKMVTIIKIDAKRMDIIYPGIQAYVEYPFSDRALSELNVQKDLVKLQKTELGQETVNGHPCTKTKVVESETNKPTEEGIVWYAADLQQFPIKMELQTKGQMMRFDFQKVKIKKPNMSLFEISTNYIALTNSADVMRYANEKFQNDMNVMPK